MEALWASLDHVFRQSLNQILIQETRILAHSAKFF